MHISCTICTELVNEAENIHVTKCGHIFHHQCLSQWISRSKSCPQCRNKVTKNCTYRLYPTISNESTGDDAATLQSRLDDAQLQLRQQNASFKEKEEKLVALEKELKRNITYIKQQLAVEKSNNENLQNKIHTLEEKLENKKNQTRDKLQTMKQQLAVEKSNNENLQNKIHTLEEKLENKKNQTRDKLQTMKQQLAVEKSNNENLQNKIHTLEEKLENKKNQTRDKLQTMKQQLAVEKSNNENLQNKIHTLEEKLENKKNQTRDKLQTMKQQLAVEKSNNENLQNKIHTLEEKLAKSRRKNENAEGKRKSLTDDSWQIVKKMKITHDLNGVVLNNDNNISIIKQEQENLSLREQLEEYQRREREEAEQKASTSRQEISPLQGVEAFLICKTIGIGSYMYTPIEKVHISVKGVIIDAPFKENELKDVAIQIQFEDIVKVLVHSGKDPVILLYTMTKCDVSIRKALGMEEGSDTIRITLLPEVLTDETKVALQTLFHKAIGDLDIEEANEILARYWP